MAGITFNRNPRSLEEACKKKTREGREIGKEGTESGVEGKSRKIIIGRQTRYRARKMSARYSIDDFARRSGAKRLDSSFAFSLDDDGDDASVWPV